MTAEQLQQLKDAFNADYNSQKVIGALDVAFGEEIDKKNISSTDYARKYQNEATAANIVESVKLIGYYDNQNIYVFDITLRPNCHIAHARVGIKRLVTQLMDNYSFAILLFHYEDTANTEWRISWVTKGGSSNKTNAAKRYTFLCGAMHPSRTIVERLSQISTSKCALLPDKITEAFSVETLSDEFFAEYKAFYEDIVQYICGARYVKGAKDKYVRTPIESEQTIAQRGIFEEFIKQVPDEISDEEKRIEEAEKLVRNYVKKLLGRLVFIQFIAKKGWMGLKQNDDWGEGEEHFLRNIYDDYKKPSAKDNFVCDVLNKVLFYSLNNTNATDGDVAICTNQINTTIYKFPYLNGGLFEETALDNLGINIPGYFFVSNEKDSNGRSYGDDDEDAPKNTPRRFKGKPREGEQYSYDQSEGLFEFFERYNFTIDENDSDEAVVGIDPEMLGKIFENLLEDNKDKGAFYTPKPVVGYMCQQSLIAYLQNSVLKEKEHLHTHLSDEEIKWQIEQFVKTKNTETISGEYGG